MFSNLTLRGFTLRREPVLYAWLAVAVAQTIAEHLAGSIDQATAVSALVELIVAFAVRGRVSPVPSEKA